MFPILSRFRFENDLRFFQYFIYISKLHIVHVHTSYPYMCGIAKKFIRLHDFAIFHFQNFANKIIVILYD